MRRSCLLLSPRPELDLQLLGGALDSRVTFTRASSATYFDAAGVLQTVASNGPRFDHRYNSMTGLWDPLGLMVEEARTNLLLQSGFASGWTTASSSLAASAIPGPDGTYMRKLVSASSASTQHYTQQNATFGAGALTLSVYGKQGECVGLHVQMSDLTSSVVNAVVALTPGTIGAPSVGSSWSAATAQIENVGGGVFRAALTATKSLGSSAGVQLFLYSGGSVTFAGDGTSGLYLAGAQLEAGSPTSLIPTTTGTATRAADVVSVAVANGSYDVLVQDRGGSEWRNGATVSGGSYSLTPRSGQRHIARLRMFPAGVVASAQKSVMQVAA